MGFILGMLVVFGGMYLVNKYLHPGVGLAIDLVVTTLIVLFVALAFDNALVDFIALMLYGLDAWNFSERMKKYRAKQARARYQATYPRERQDQ